MILILLRSLRNSLLFSLTRFRNSLIVNFIKVGVAGPVRCAPVFHFCIEFVLKHYLLWKWITFTIFKLRIKVSIWNFFCLVNNLPLANLSLSLCNSLHLPCWNEGQKVTGKFILMCRILKLTFLHGVYFMLLNMLKNTLVVIYFIRCTSHL